MKEFDAVTEEIVASCKDLLSKHGLEVKVEDGPEGAVLIAGRGEGYDQPLQVSVQVFQSQPKPDEVDAGPYPPAHAIASE